MVKNKTVQKKVEGGKYGYILTTVVGRIGARGNVVKAKKNVLLRCACLLDKRCLTASPRAPPPPGGWGAPPGQATLLTFRFLICT